MGQRATFLIVSILGGVLVACRDDGADPHAHDDVPDAAAPLDQPADLSSPQDIPATDDATMDAVPGDTRGDLGATCNPSCGTGQVCCADQHGHFPACLVGSACPDAGGS